MRFLTKETNPNVALIRRAATYGRLPQEQGRIEQERADANHHA